MIKSSGHLIGPFEVESALIEHPAVAEAGVIGMPDPVVVRDREGVRRAEARLRADARRCAASSWRTRASGSGPAVAPREIDFRDNLPKTRSGKIMRRLLKARELGPARGRHSTLESDEREPALSDRAT